MDDNQSVEALLKQGIQAAKANDYSTARPLLERVVEQDQHNEKGWFWLAAITDDIDEKRICLNNVLVLNPENKRAQQLLAQLEKTVSKTLEEPVAQPPDVHAEVPVESAGAARGGKRFFLLVTGIVLVLVFGGGAALLLLGGNDNGSSADPTDSSAGPDASESEPVPDSPPLAGNLPTVTSVPPVTQTSPPPTWTPVPSSTPVPQILPTFYPAPPSSLAGNVILESGNVPGDRENHPIVLMAADGSGQRLLSGDARGHTPVLSPDGSQYAYIEFLSGTREVILKLDNIQGTNPRNASIYWQNGTIGGLFEQDTPDWSPDGGWIAFTAVGMGAVLPDLYRVAVVESGEGSTSLQRLTRDDVIESWPAHSPDGAFIVYVADKSRLEFNTPVDLNIYNIETGEITSLTTNGADIIEAAPDWSPDGRSIIFQGREAEASDWDIYRISLYGGGEPEKIIDSEFNDIRPRYSPNGRYILFSSDRSGNWDVFIYDMTQDDTYQLTTSPEDDIANDWSR